MEDSDHPLDPVRLKASKSKELGHSEQSGSDLTNSPVVCNSNNGILTVLLMPVNLIIVLLLQGSFGTYLYLYIAE